MTLLSRESTEILLTRGATQDALSYSSMIDEQLKTR